MGEYVTISYDVMEKTGCDSVQAAEWIGRKLWACYGRWLPMTLSIVEQTHQDDLRARSIQLAIERGHLRNG